MGRLENKVAIVTGGARGLGKTYCLRMAEEGAKVVVADLLDREAEETVSEDKAMLVNAKGTWLCCKAVFPQMKKQGKGKIINVSTEAVFAPTKGFIHYTASKAAVIGITRVLAGELGQYGICVNVIVPGVVDTEATRTYLTIEKFDVSSVPLGRVELPEDVVGSVIFFASDDSDFVSGQSLLIDGARRVH